jgi:hypothetical protein
MDDNSYEITGHSPAQVLCMRTNPSLSLIKFLIEHNPIAFNASCCALNPDVLIYPLHLAAEYSESMELLQIFLQLDKSVTIIKLDSITKRLLRKLRLEFCVGGLNLQHG